MVRWSSNEAPTIVGDAHREEVVTVMTAQRVEAQARAARAHRSAEVARMRRRNRGDARARTAAVLRDLAGRIDTRDGAPRPLEAGW